MLTYLLNRVENIVSKGEIARFEQFLLLSQSFQKSTAKEASASVYMWERVTSHKLIHRTSAKRAFIFIRQHGHILICSCNKSAVVTFTRDAGT